MFNTKTLLSASLLIGSAVLAYSLMTTTPAHGAPGGHVFELRTYTATPGNLENLQARFRNHTLRIFAKHGMKNVGYWVPQDEPRHSNTLIYVLQHESREAATKSWNDFRADPEWKKVAAESEANGKIVEKVESV